MRFPAAEGLCACTHPAAGHDPDDGCLAVIGVGAFCNCSGVRVPPHGVPHMEIRMLQRVRASLDDAHMPSWTAYARCRSAALRAGDDAIGPNRPGHVAKDAYMDDISDDEVENIRLPEATVERFMEEACSPCPVRRMCLHYAYATVDAHQPYGVYGGVPGRIRGKLTETEADSWFVALAAQREWSSPVLAAISTMT